MLAADGSQLLLAAAGGGVTLWDCSTRRRTRSFAGHTGGAGALCLGFSPDGAVAFSCAHGDRTVALWGCSLSGAGSAKAPQPALARLALPDGMPLQLSTTRRAEGGFLLVAVGSSGEASVWQCAAGGAAAGAPQRVRVGPPPAPGRTASDDCVLAAAAVEGDGGALLPHPSLLPLSLPTAHCSLFGGWPPTLPGLSARNTVLQRAQDGGAPRACTLPPALPLFADSMTPSLRQTTRLLPFPPSNRRIAVSCPWHTRALRISALRAGRIF